MSLNHPHPGTIIYEETMVPLGLTLSQSAGRFGVAEEDLAEVIAGNVGITQDLAEGLERAGFSTARFWMALQAEYDRSGDA